MNILLVRLRLIGDVVFTTPIIGALRRRFPSAHLTYLVESGAAPVVQTNSDLSNVITARHSRGWRRLADDLALGRTLRATRYDVAIDLHGGPRSAWLTWLSRAPMRVGYDVPGRSWMYTTLVHRPRTLTGRHSVENQWDLLAPVDASFRTPPDSERDRVLMPVDRAAAASTSERLHALGVPATARLVVLHVSAGNPFRRWPELSFSELAARLVGLASDVYVLITGGPSDREAAHRVIERAQSTAGGEARHRILSAEALSLAELRATMDRAALFIGGDSGPLHIAATSDVPIVALYGPTLPERSAPWRPARLFTASIDAGPLPCRPCDQRVCEPGDFRCLAHIPADAVFSAAARCLTATS